MGLFQSRQEHGVEDIDIPVARTYGYPPKCGNYFASHFMMGGEKFDTVNPECFLFGENNDLNYLCNKPTPFPYPSPTGSEPSKTLRSLVHLRKDTLRLIRDSENGVLSDGYSIEFMFDTDVACAARLYLFATENLAGGIARYTCRSKQSEPVFYRRGSSQVHKNKSFVIVPSSFDEAEFQYQPGGNQNEAMAIPIVIQLTVEEEDFSSQSEVTFATFEKNSDGTYSIKFLKQKIIADGVCYIIQEIYGIENKKDGNKDKDDDLDENGTECVICMCDTRDTLILPCRHLCLCNGCANSLRYQASTCPICRSPFHALLQIKAVRRKTMASGTENEARAYGKEGNQDSEEYEEVPLVDALNGYLPADGATGYSSRQSSARRSKSRSGSRPSSRKSRTGSRNGCRPNTNLPPVDKVEQLVHGGTLWNTDPNHEQPKTMAVLEAAETEETVEVADEASQQPIFTSTVKDDGANGHQDSLQESLQSTILQGMIKDAPNFETEGGDLGADLPNSVDLSLPGTPMGSDFSNQSSSSMSTQNTASTTAGSTSSIYVTQAQVSTPSNVNFEEKMD